MASRREMLLAAQRKNEKKEQENTKKEETLVDVYANSTEKSIIVNNDTSSKNEINPAKTQTNDSENAENTQKNSAEYDKNQDLTPATVEVNKPESMKDNIKSKEIKSQNNYSEIKNNTVQELIKIQKEKDLKKNRIGFLVTDKALDNLNRYVEMTGYKSKNEFMNIILENLDDFLK